MDFSKLVTNLLFFNANWFILAYLLCSWKEIWSYLFVFMCVFLCLCICMCVYPKITKTYIKIGLKTIDIYSHKYIISHILYIISSSVHWDQQLSLISQKFDSWTKFYCLGFLYCVYICLWRIYDTMSQFRDV